ncbi:MAG: hypothetical protein JXP34_07380 [Planctomycetes bacterium]|nr:hypothetical protein [Planctomycetota bacterium]
MMEVARMESQGTEGTLVLDLDICRGCPSCDAVCSCAEHPRNDGVRVLRELAARAYICRRCEEPACIAACERDALSRGEDGIIRRSPLRCVGCQSCVIACFQGTLTPDLIAFPGSACDRCAGRGVPACASSCAPGAIRWFETLPEDAVRIADGIAVRGATWKEVGA